MISLSINKYYTQGASKCDKVTQNGSATGTALEVLVITFTLDSKSVLGGTEEL